MRHGLTEARNRHHDNDSDRNLTPEGRNTLKQFVPLIQPWFPVPDTLIVSPAVRTRQTAEILCEMMKIPATGLVSDPLILHGSAGEIACWLYDTDLLETVWIVGHQPTLGQLFCAYMGLDLFKGFHMKPGDCTFLRFSETPEIKKGHLMSYASPDLINTVTGNR